MDRLGARVLVVSEWAGLEHVLWPSESGQAWSTCSGRQRVDRLGARARQRVDRLGARALVVRECAGLEHVLRRLIVIPTMTGCSACLADPLEVGSQTTVSSPQAKDDRPLFSVKLT